MSDCIFCKIVDGKIPSKFLFESDSLIVIKDIRPAADTHLLIISKKHIPTFEDIKKSDDDLISEMFEVARRFIKGTLKASPAKDMGLKKKYRVSFNGGSLLEVHHLHMHLLGGNLKGNYND